MTFSIKHDIQSQANAFYQQFTQEKARIDQLSPQKQIYTLGNLQSEALLFTELQQRVEKIARENMQTAHGFNEEEWDILSSKLIESATILESIEENNVIATTYIDIDSEIAALQSQTHPNRNEITSVQERIENIIKQYSFSINRTNREALESARQKLQAFTQPGFAPTPSNSSQNQKIREQQDEEYDASLFTNQHQELLGQLCNDPLKDFETVIAYYSRIKAYSLSKPSYLSVPAGVSIMTCLSKAEELLQNTINLQAQNEQAPQAQPNQSQPLKDLQQVVEQLRQAQAKKGDMETPKNKMNELFRNLPPEQKDALFQELNSIQKPRSQRDLSKALLGQNFADWPATLGNKIEAIDARVRKIQSASNEPIAPVIVKHTDEMNRRFLAIKNQQAVVQKSQQPSPRSQGNTALPPLPDIDDDTDFIFIGDDPSNQTTQNNIPKEWYLPDNIDLNSLRFEDFIPPIENEPPEVQSGNTLSIQNLQGLLPLLQHNASDVQLENACFGLSLLGSTGCKAVFRMSGTHPTAIPDRPFYHLYWIHKNERPHSLVEDAQYGNKAFAGFYPATNEERTRVIQRTIVELTLDSIEDAISFEDSVTLGKLLRILEEVKLHAKDRAGEQENAAYNLFAAFYNLQVAARSNRPSLIDPNHAQFNGDFGRVAFHKTMQGIDPAIKIAAINQVLNAFKAVWNLQ